MLADPVDIARLFLHVREVGQNQGQRVNAIQMFSGGAPAIGTSWCTWFATMVLDLCFAGKSPIPRMGGCQDIFALAQKNQWMTETPSTGDLFLYVDANDHAHHIGIFVGWDADQKPIGIAGNTDASGTSNNGDRVAEHTIGAAKYIAYPHG